jgi:hypothetical protein
MLETLIIVILIVWLAGSFGGRRGGGRRVGKMGRMQSYPCIIGDCAYFAAYQVPALRCL